MHWRSARICARATSRALHNSLRAYRTHCSRHLLLFMRQQRLLRHLGRTAHLRAAAACHITSHAPLRWHSACALRHHNAASCPNALNRARGMDEHHTRTLLNLCRDSIAVCRVTRAYATVATWRRGGTFRIRMSVSLYLRSAGKRASGTPSTKPRAARVSNDAAGVAAVAQINTAVWASGGQTSRLADVWWLDGASRRFL